MVLLIIRFFNWIKNLFTKNIVNTELTEEEKYCLIKLERWKRWSEWEGKNVYLRNGSYNLVLGWYSYPDIDITQRGYIVKDINTGNIKDVGHDMDSLFFQRKPHEWLESLTFTDQYQYFEDTFDLSDSELHDKYINKISKENLREIRLKQLGL